jgi:AraC-like DNA-binding protein
MEPSFSRLHFRWLLDGAEDSFAFSPGDGDLEHQSLNFPPELGQGHFDHVNLALGMSLYRSTHRLLPAASGHLIPVAEIEVDHGGPAFVAQSLRGGRICQQERFPQSNLIFEEGRDFFLHIQKRQVLPLVDGSSDSTMVALQTRLTTLERLLGEPEAAALLRALDLTALPSVAVRTIPRQVSAPLHQAMARSLSGAARKLYAQGKVLEYLSGLSEHLSLESAGDPSASLLNERVAACRDHLLGLEGKLPSLVALAQTFKVPAKRLNAAFSETYGQTIFAFITAHRLDLARHALLETDVPMKALAHKLGYSHVNNFITAFQKRFGQSPGSLRTRDGKPLKPRIA